MLIWEKVERRVVLNSVVLLCAGQSVHSFVTDASSRSPASGSNFRNTSLHPIRQRLTVITIHFVAEMSVNISEGWLVSRSTFRNIVLSAPGGWRQECTGRLEAGVHREAGGRSAPGGWRQECTRCSELHVSPVLCIRMVFRGV